MSRDYPESMAELRLLDPNDLAAMAMGAAVLPRNPTHKAFGSTVTLLQNRDDPATTFRTRNFPSAKSFSITFTNSAAVRCFHSFGEAFG